MKAKEHIKWSETLKEAVERCCMKKDEWDGRMAKPWIADGRLYATNGHLLVYLPGGFLKVEVSDDGPPAGTLVTKAAALVGSTITVRTSELLDAIGGLDVDFVPNEVACDKCDGDGRWECTECGTEHECEECTAGFYTPDDAGEMFYPGNVVVSFFGARFNPKYLERIVDLARIAGADEIDFGVWKYPETSKALAFRIGRMAGLLMPMSSEDQHYLTLPPRIVPVTNYSAFPAPTSAQ